MYKTVVVVVLFVVALVSAGCSKEADTKLDQAKQKASEAAQSAQDAFGEIADEAGKTAKDAQESVASAAASAKDALKEVAGGPELMKKVTDFFDTAGKTLQGITDVESAKAALPKLNELSASTDDFSALMAKLPEGARSNISSVMEKGIAELKVLADKVMALPGVESVIKPSVNELMEKLAAIANKKD